MQKRRGRFFLCFLVLAVMGTGSAFALEVKGTAPEFYTTKEVLQPFVGQVNNEVKTIFNEALGKINEEAGKIDDNPQKLMGAFGTSSIFSSHAATQRVFGGYKLFAVTAGPMIGLQVPGDPSALVNEIVTDSSAIITRLEEEQDIKLGLNPQIYHANISLNLSKIAGFQLWERDLYVGLKFGAINLSDIGVEGLSFNTFTLGATANYQFFKQQSLAAGVLLWRGLNFGTGIIYQGTKLGYRLAMDPIKEQTKIASVNIDGDPSLTQDTITVTVDPNLDMAFKIDTVTIPLEASTSVRLLWFLNLGVGLGVDVGFGVSDLSLNADATIKAATDNTSLGIKQKEGTGSLSLDAGGKAAPSFFNPKAMVDVGFSFGPVVIDIPITFYLDNGYSVGFTLGVVW